ncbi:MAG TPA: DUF4389 domain-containing protein, partial [Mariprofundaceae bacterium]|nr:DUF4389 domain-containing protein [Mariprofundaceae bacterium]
MSDEQLKENVKNSSAWMRLLFMLLFAVLYSVAEMVLTVVVIFQFLSVLITGRKNAKVLSLGAQLATYAYQVFSYLTYNSEERPFPFADWPADKPLTGAAPAAAPKKATAAEPAKAPAR